MSHSEPIVIKRPKLSPELLVEKMGTAAYDMEEAHRNLRRIEKELKKTEREEKAKIIIMARRLDLIKNEKVKEHLQSIVEKEKKITLEILNSLVYMECQAVFDEYNYWKTVQKDAEKEHDIWYKHLLWYMSQNKVKAAEIMNGIETGNSQEEYSGL